MRLPLAFLALSLAAVVTAERVARPVQMTATDVLVTDRRVAPLPEGGFAVLDGQKVVAFDRDGRNPKELFAFPSVPDGWWIDGTGAHSARNQKGRLIIDLPKFTFEIGDATKDGVGFAPDGLSGAAVCGGVLVRFATTAGSVKTWPAPESAAWAGRPAWSADGKSILALRGAPGRPTDLVVQPGDGALADARVLYSSKAGALSCPVFAGDSALVIESGGALDRVLRVPLEGGEAEEVAQGKELADLAVGAEQDEAAFSGKAANGRRSVFSVGLSRQGTRRSFPVDLLGFAEGCDVVSPQASGPASWWVLKVVLNGKVRVTRAGNRP